MKRSRPSGGASWARSSPGFSKIGSRTRRRHHHHRGGRSAPRHRARGHRSSPYRRSLRRFRVASLCRKTERHRGGRGPGHGQRRPRRRLRVCLQGGHRGHVLRVFARGFGADGHRARHRCRYLTGGTRRSARVHRFGRRGRLPLRARRIGAVRSAAHPLDHLRHPRFLASRRAHLPEPRRAIHRRARLFQAPSGLGARDPREGQARAGRHPSRRSAHAERQVPAGGGGQAGLQQRAARGRLFGARDGQLVLWLVSHGARGGARPSKVRRPHLVGFVRLWLGERWVRAARHRKAGRCPLARPLGAESNSTGPVPI